MWDGLKRCGKLQSQAEGRKEVREAAAHLLQCQFSELDLTCMNANGCSDNANGSCICAEEVEREELGEPALRDIL